MKILEKRVRAAFSALAAMTEHDPEQCYDCSRFMVGEGYFCPIAQKHCEDNLLKFGALKRTLIRTLGAEPSDDESQELLVFASRYVETMGAIFTHECDTCEGDLPWAYDLCETRCDLWLEIIEGVKEGVYA